MPTFIICEIYGEILRLNGNHRNCRPNNKRWNEIWPKFFFLLQLGASFRLPFHASNADNLWSGWSWFRCKVAANYVLFTLVLQPQRGPRYMPCDANPLASFLCHVSLAGLFFRRSDGWAHTINLHQPHWNIWMGERLARVQLHKKYASHWIDTFCILLLLLSLLLRVDFFLFFFRNSAKSTTASTSFPSLCRLCQPSRHIIDTKSIFSPSAVNNIE